MKKRDNVIIKHTSTCLFILAFLFGIIGSSSASEINLSDTYWNTGGENGVVSYNPATDIVSMSVEGTGSQFPSGPNGMNRHTHPFCADSNFKAEFD